MTPETKLQATLPRSFSLDQPKHTPSLLQKIESSNLQRSASARGFFPNMRKVSDKTFNYGNIANAGLTRLVSRLPSQCVPSRASTLSEQKGIALIELSTALGNIDRCQKIGLADSTTGAHCAMDENYAALFMVKSNDECFFEFIGNCVAEKLDLNIPGFALIDHATEQYGSLKEKLSSNNPYPCILSEYREAVNLKEVDRGSPLEPIESFKTLGKAFMLDLVIGNWDRFPVFPGDTQGNYGNLMYEQKTQKLLFIDIVAMKHTEIGGYQSQDYFDFSAEKIKSTLGKITQWLQPKFPQLNVSEETMLAFHQGMQEATRALLKHQSSLSEMCHGLKKYLQDQIQTYAQKVMPDILRELKDKLSATEALTTNPSAQSPEALLNTIQARIPEVITDRKAAERISERITRGGGLPQIGPLKTHAEALKKDPIFGEAWHEYCELTTQRETQQKQQKILSQLKNSSQIVDQLDAFLEDIDRAGLKKTEAAEQLIMVHAETENLTESIKKLDMMIANFDSIDLKLKAVLN